MHSIRHVMITHTVHDNSITTKSNSIFRACTTIPSPIGWSAKAGCAVRIFKGYDLWASVDLANQPSTVCGSRLSTRYQQIKGYDINNVELIEVLIYSLNINSDGKVNGHAFLSLNESRLEGSRVSLGFQCTVIDIIKDLVRDIISSGITWKMIIIIYRRGASKLLSAENHHHHSSSLQQVE